MLNIVGILPKLIRVDDYHEFDSLQDVFRATFGQVFPRIKIRELGLRNGKYVGVVYNESWAETKKYPIVQRELKLITAERDQRYEND